MGRKVNVVLPSGRVVSVDEDTAQASQLSTDTTQQLANQALQQGNTERSAGVVEGLKAGAEGFADAATLGLYGATRGVLDPEGARNMRIRAEERAGSRMAGEVAALLIPTGDIAALGKLGKVGRAGEFLAPGLAKSAGELVAEQAGSKLAGQFVDGAIQGLGGYVSSTNISGDQLTIEAAMQEATIGGIVNTGMHVAANRLEGFGWAGKLRDAKNRELAATLEVAEKGKKVFKETPAAWDEFVDLHEARQAAANAHNAKVAQAAAKYDGFWQNNAKLTKAIDETDEMLSEVQHSVYKQQGGPFAGTPDRMKVRFGKDGKAVGVDAKFEGGSQKFDFDGSDSRTVIQGPNGEQYAAEGAPRLRQQIVDKDGRPVISDETLEKVKEYKARISKVYQQKGGGWAMKEGKWVRDPSVPPDPKGAMENLRVIQEELKQWRPKYSGQMKEQLPAIPPPPMPTIPGKLPKSIEEFSRKHAEQVLEIAQSMDPTSHGAVARVMKDLDLEISGDAVKDLTALHETLRTYKSKIAEIGELAAKEAAEEDAKGPVLKWLRKAARYTAGRAADTGGAFGAIRRQLGGSLATRGMAAVEGAVMGYAAGHDAESAALGAALMASRQTLRGRIRTLVEKHSAGGASLMRQLGSPLAYLQSSFPDGQKDPERDPKKQALNRMQEIRAAAMTAPDAAFMGLQGMMGQPGDIAWKMHQHVVGTLNYLMSTLPADPGTDTKLFGSHWTPQYHESIALAHRLEAVHDPLTAIARAIAGNSHPAATEALWAMYPAMMNELAQELSVAAPNLKNLTYEQASAYSNLFRTPLTGLQQPVVFTTIQGLYMNSPSAAPQPTGPSGGAPKKAVGRPAAVQSPNAGSNVAMLTS